MKVLIVGLGGIGQRHVRNLRTLLGAAVDIMAYRIRRESPVLTDKLEVEQGRTLEEKYNIRVFGNMNQALDQRPEAVFVCNPSSLHISIAMMAAQAGCHLFIEKPLSQDYNGVEDLINEVEKRNLVSLVGYQMRFHPCILSLRSFLQQRLVGRILAVRAQVGEYLPGWHKYEDYRQMYASRKDLGGGVILSQIHEMDYLFSLFGMPHRIFALGGHLSSLEIDVEDTASILMECVVEGRSLPVHLHQDYVQRPPSRTCEIIGDAGKILIDFFALSVQVFGNDGALIENITFEGFQRNQLFLDELEHFLECMKGRQSPVVNVREGAQSLRIALAAKESLATGQVVSLKGNDGQGEKKSF